MANVKDKEGWTPLHRNCQQPPPKEKNNSQNNNEAIASKQVNSAPGTNFFAIRNSETND